MKRHSGFPHRATARRLLALVLLLVSGAAADAAFVAGLESFQGTVKDTLTWEETVEGNGSSTITQDDQLAILGYGGWPDYTTTFTVGIGESVEVEVVDFGTPGLGSHLFALTTNTGGTTASTIHESFVGIMWNAGIQRFLTAFSTGTGSVGGSGLGPAALPTDQTYVLRLLRNSTTSFTFTIIRKADSAVLGTLVDDASIALPAQLYVSLSSADPTPNVFDEVFIPSLVDRCGDGVTDPRFGEECDDGNTTAGDCCSSTCTLEAAGTPCDDATVCNGAETCDGAGTCQPGLPPNCDDGDLCTTDTCEPTLGCENVGVPWLGCTTGFAKGSLLVKESQPGKEKLLAKLKKLDATILPEDFGDPVSGSTAYALCVFDQDDTLAGSLEIARAGETCAGKACWRATGFGWQYKDKDAIADGVSKLELRGGPSGKGQLQVKAGNKASKGQSSLPLGLASGLLSSTSVRLQLVGSDAPQCFEATLDQVVRQEPDLFKALRK